MPWADAISTLLPLHRTLAATTGLLFTLRGIGVLLGHGWPKAKPVRRASMVIDTALLAAGVALWALLGLAPWRDLWLGVKLVVLLVYIAFGALALGHARTRGQRALCFGLALLAYAQIVATALTRDPRGLLLLV